MSKYEELSPEQVYLATKEGQPVLLDIRDEHSYRESHIDGAMLSHDGLMQSLIQKKEYDRPIIIYCYHGINSRETAEFFGALGFNKVYSMAGGYVAWKKWQGDQENAYIGLIVNI